MLKKITKRKIAVASLSLFTLLMIYLMPSKNDKISNLKTDITYKDSIIGVIYLIDSDDYVARTNIITCDCDTISKAKDIVDALIIDGQKSNIIPNGFRSIIPSGTTILDLNLDNKVLTINFSKELLEISDKYSEKMIESIIYTLTSIDGIDKVIIKVEGNILDKIPNTEKTLNTYLDKSYGINKTYDITTTSNIDNYTIYYVNSFNDNYYYVPVTKYINNPTKEDKVKIIIDELSNSNTPSNNLASYLDGRVMLNKYELNDESIKLFFNDMIYSNTGSNKILEEVLYTIGLSLEDLYNIKTVSFYVDDTDIVDLSLKNIK